MSGLGDKLQGKAQEATGAAKEQVGKVIDSSEQEGSGLADQAKGQGNQAKGAVKEAVGDIKDTVRSKTN